jgi:hypothetical protein
MSSGRLTNNRNEYGSALRIGVVGPFTYFSCHFPEKWSEDRNVLCLDVNEADYSFLLNLYNFRPDITLFYRPELYPRRFVEMIPGKRIAFLSEPVPGIKNGKLHGSLETNLRLSVYAGMTWSAFDRCIYYDSSKAETILELGWPIDSYSMLPIDTSVFNFGNIERDIDVCFVGKATEHRIKQMDFLRNEQWRYVWVAHGASGSSLASLFQRSKVILNIHADGLAAQEPRVLLAAACGAIVLSEPVPLLPLALRERVVQYPSSLTREHISDALRKYERTKWRNRLDGLLGARDFIARQFVSTTQGGSDA